MNTLEKMSIKNQSIYYKYLVSYYLSSIIPLLILVYFAYQYIFPFIQFRRPLTIGPDTIRLIILLTLFSSLLGFYLALDIIRAINVLAERARIIDQLKGRRIIESESRLRLKRNDELGVVSTSLELLLKIIHDQLARLDYLMQELELSKRALEEATQKFGELAIIDETTGLYNGRYINSRLEEEMKRANRFSRSFAFLLLSLNNLDRCPIELEGKEETDIIASFGGLVAKNVREIDIVGRMTDYELSVIMPEAGREETSAISENIINSCANEFKYEMKLGLSINIGGAFYPNNATDVGSLVEKATQALNMAKASGKNKFYLM